MFKKGLPLLVYFLVLGCANPDYLTPEEISRQQDKKPSSTCDLMFNSLQICAQAQWDRPPSSTEVGALQLTLSPAPGETLFALLWMPSMGHGSAPVKVLRLADGHYKITNMYFIMPGDWEVRLFLKNSAGEIIDQHFIPLMVP